MKEHEIVHSGVKLTQEENLLKWQIGPLTGRHAHKFLIITQPSIKQTISCWCEDLMSVVQSHFAHNLCHCSHQVCVASSATHTSMVTRRRESIVSTKLACVCAGRLKPQWVFMYFIFLLKFPAKQYAWAVILKNSGDQIKSLKHLRVCLHSSKKTKKTKPLSTFLNAKH